MRKLLLTTLCLAAAILVSCGSDDEESETTELQFVDVRVEMSDGSIPTGNVYLFRVPSGYSVDAEDLYFSTLTYRPHLKYTYSSKSDDMYPISDYGKASKGELSPYSALNYAHHVIYWYALSSRYGTPQAGDKYIIAVFLNGDFVWWSSHQFSITKNSTITVKLPASSPTYDSSIGGYSVYNAGTWTMEDYKSVSEK